MNADQKPLVGASEYMERALTEWKAVGVAVAVVRDAEVIYKNGFGLRVAGSGSGVDPETLFQVGSTTKAFTTAALGVLIDEGKILWDDLVARILPEFQLQDPWVTRYLNIRDSVVHRSGVVGDWYPFLAVMNSEQTIRNLRSARSMGAFRDCFLYSNPMYAIAGKVIEAVSGMTWSAFVKSRLLEPLDMRRSGCSPYEYWDSQDVAPTFFGSAPSGHFSPDLACDNNLAMPHGWDSAGATVVLPWQSYDNAAAAGSLVSSVSDMANWLILHLNDGRFKGHQVLTRETIRELHAMQNVRVDPKLFPLMTERGAGRVPCVPRKPKAPIAQPPEAECPLGYAMGWHRGVYRGHVHFSHSGGILGFPAYAAFMPDVKLGLVVLANGPRSIRDDYGLNKAIGFWLFDRLLGEKPRDWSREYLSWIRAVRQAADEQEMELQDARLRDVPASRPLDKYTGVYEDSIGLSGPVAVAVEHGRLRLSFFGQGAFSAYLEHWHGDLLRINSNAVADEVFDMAGLGSRFVKFALDEMGRIDSMNLFGKTLLRISP